MSTSSPLSGPAGRRLAGAADLLPAEAVGRLAATHGVPLRRPADGATGFEELFLDLTRRRGTRQELGFVRRRLDLCDPATPRI
ncbi:MAG: hypothetical protein AVDCRST_MAG53-1748 [uncultured Solirubrobacteraceae bacterium]|uniref:Uncharacterized protein n=1 Tax=uncultured Solirubrobacteraceae bacterium TaxID=1162706 RepID=A0A6J4SKW7_9ACTN|nr:MAG: hypothetical protein AVDCRST_MAG53-1748 [uncultured Solirubrobacteraceae bacterium]